MIHVLVMTAVMSARGDGLELARQLVVDDGVATAALAQSRTIYLNRHGVTLSPGGSDARIDRTSLVSAQTAIPAWQVTPALWADTVACVRDMFAPFDVQITEHDPGNVPHVEAVFGGSPELMGFSPRVAGIAPFSTSCRTIENAMVFAFADAMPQDAQTICEVAAQEIGHAFGLDHVLLAADPMSYQPFSDGRSFQDKLSACGESAARPCGAEGYPSCRDQQNSFALLAERLGASASPDVEPHTADTGDDELDVDDAAELAGCSTGPGASLWLALALLGLVRRRGL